LLISASRESTLIISDDQTDSYFWLSRSRLIGPSEPLGSNVYSVGLQHRCSLFHSWLGVVNVKHGEFLDLQPRCHSLVHALSQSCEIEYNSNGLQLVSCSYRQEYFENAIEKPIPFFDAEDNTAGSLTSRLSNDPTQLQEMLGLNMAMVLIAIFSMIGCTAISFAFGWKLTIVTFFAAVPVILAASFTRLRFEVQFEKMNALVFAESSQFAAEAISATRTVAALTLEDMICDRFEALLQAHVNKATKKARYSQAVFALSDSVELLCMALVFWYGCRLMVSGEYNAEQFFVIYTAMIYGSQGAGQWVSFGPNMAQAAAAANRILSFRVREDSASTPSVNKPFGDDKSSDGGSEISFQDVYFRYPTRDIPIFAGLNMTIKKGQFAGIVGASGSGKTTIISLLEQFYQPDKGNINLDGTNVADINRNEYRKSISLVAQEPTLFQGTIKENILLGVETGSTTEEDLHSACRDAEIHDFIASLPDGYLTDIGSKGVALSGGQKQRIAIARALIRRPRILLLDEATSSLDSESEKLVQGAFERAGKGRTMVVVAHRLATVQNADVIFVLGKDGEGAKVLEKGTHGELVARKGVYYQMCKSQALDR
jgi:ATP-binding cassette subfamily B (MDR/TAP) protein 1